MLMLERIIWAIATVMLFASGLYFTLKLGLVQFKIVDMLKSFKEDKKDSGISPFKSLTMTLGARIGVGSLAGIALALYYGGPGSIFWIWISTIFCSANAFSESLLGVLYRKIDKEGYVGGPSYYIEHGLKNRFLGKTYAFVIIFAYVVGFLTVQSNTIVKSVTEIYDIKPVVISLIISILALVVILKGLKSIANFSAKLVPVMTIGYTLVCFFIIGNNLDKLGDVISLIVTEAFNPISMGVGIITPIIIGFQRGTFANEAGIGTGAIASAAANTDSPSKQGFIQVFGIYIETLILSTITAIVVILSNYKDLIWNNINGIEITQKAFSYHLGYIGNYVVMISIILFAFSTIITGYYYGEANLKFLYKKISKQKLNIFKFVVVSILLTGGVSSPTIIWLLADIFIVILGLINVYSIFSLRQDVINQYKLYKLKKKWYN